MAEHWSIYGGQELLYLSLFHTVSQLNTGSASLKAPECFRIPKSEISVGAACKARPGMHKVKRGNDLEREPGYIQFVGVIQFSLGKLFDA